MMRSLMLFHAAKGRRVRVLKRSKCFNVNYLRECLQNWLSLNITLPRDRN